MELDEFKKQVKEFFDEIYKKALLHDAASCSNCKALCSHSHVAVQSFDCC